MTEERNIQQLVPKQMHFRTPDGYFEGLTDRIMARLPEGKAAKTKRRKAMLHVWHYAAAAVFVGIVAIGSVLLTEKNHEEKTDIAASNADNVQYMNDALDYALINNDDIAAYLTDNE